MSIFAVDAERCNFCGLCAIECPVNIIFIKGSDTLPFMSRSGEGFCINCGHCVAVCPPGAISLQAMKPADCAAVTTTLLPTPDQVELFLKSRRSVRVFRDEPVPRETLAKLIDIARYAPSGSNSQPVQWLVVEDPLQVQHIGGLVVDWMRSAINESPDMADLLPLNRMLAAQKRGEDPIMRKAPHVIVAHAPRELTSAQGDGSIALTYLELAAYSLGVGACWAGFVHFAAMSYRPMREAMQLPKGHHSLGAMMIGYPKHRLVRIPLRNEPKIIWR